MTEIQLQPPPAKKNGALTFALDFGPLLLFFLASKFGASEIDPTKGPLKLPEPDKALLCLRMIAHPTQGALVGTGVFMIAIILAVMVSKWKLGRVAPMMWLSAILVIGFGGLAIWMHDPKFIQTKPTFIYLLFAGMLLGGLLRGKALLKYVLEQAYDGLSEVGWRKLSLNWGLFFLMLAGANEMMRATLSFEMWLTLKVWGVTAITFLFGMANIPMLMKHGLSLGEEVEKK
jgi:intracellular septation protein